MKKLHIGIIASAGGSAFHNMVRCNRYAQRNHSFSVVTDRECEVESFCSEERIPHERIIESSNDCFSARAAAYFSEVNVDFVLLFYSRLVTPKLFLTLPVVNVHPSLLPAFKGMQAIRKARAAGVRYLGATLHLVNESVDDGKIIAQACMPIAPFSSAERMNKYSYLQKTALGILAMNLIEAGSLRLQSDSSDFELSSDLPFGDRLNPDLTDREYVAFFNNLQEKEGAKVL